MAARKEWNENVREEKRLEDEKRESERKKKELEKQNQRILQQQANIEAYKAAVAAADRGKELKESPKCQVISDDSSDSETEEIEYVCELCEKVFKTEKNFMNHQTSKLHLKMIEKYSAELGEISEDETSIKSDVENNNDVKNDGVNDPEIANGDHNSDSNNDEIVEDPNDLKCLFCNKDFKSLNAKESHERSKKHRDTVKKAKAEMERESKKGGGRKEEDSLKKNKKQGAEKKSNEAAAETPEVDIVEDDDFLTRFAESVKTSAANGENSDSGESVGNTARSTTATSSRENPKGDSNLGPGKKKKGNKRKNQLQNESPTSSKTESLKCQVCSFEAPSRNSLFKHLKDTKHAIIK